MSKHTQKLVRELYQFKGCKKLGTSKEYLFNKYHDNPKAWSAFKSLLKKGQNPVPVKDRTIKPTSSQSIPLLLLSDMDFKFHTRRYFNYLKISTLHELMQYTEKDFLKLRNCGKGTVQDIQRELASKLLELPKTRRKTA
jgi:DNA-directed RNA polymerase alpha subunit